jgi:hypothetical protein
MACTEILVQQRPSPSSLRGPDIHLQCYAIMRSCPMVLCNSNSAAGIQVVDIMTIGNNVTFDYELVGLTSGGVEVVP